MKYLKLFCVESQLVLHRFDFFELIKSTFLPATGAPQLCKIVDGMKKPAYIPKRNIKTSSTKKGKKPTDVRPGGRVWSSKKNDKKPRIVIKLGKKPVPTKSVKVIKPRNVKKVKVIFVLPNNKRVTKVSVHSLNIGFSI